MPTVMTFYRFVSLTGLPALRESLETEARDLNLRGTVLLAGEGINATLAGQPAQLQRFHDSLCRRPPFSGLGVRYSNADPDNPVFLRLKVRIKPEIVRFGQGEVPAATRTGEHVHATRWNELLDDPDVVVLDTRNAYEVGIGTFPGALDPGTRSFRELPDYVHHHLDPGRHRRIAMFCTGGIRCEKASAWLLDQGFDTVYQLDGGILRYLETVEPEANRWQGECFVFDQRVSVDERLTEGSFEQCFACRRPLSTADRQAREYQAGVSCPYCFDEHGPSRRAAFAERRRQVTLAAARGTRHLGGSGGNSQ